MRVHFCGVRGSTPAPGPDFVRYGGHTSCVALSKPDEEPSLILDAGTGIRALNEILTSPFRGSILLGHLHWDHSHGLPFFRAGDHPDAEVALYLPAQGSSAEAVLTEAMSPPFFPISPPQLRGKWTFEGLEEGTYDIDGYSVEVVEVPHKGGRTFGYRIGLNGASVAYLSDHHPLTMGEGPDGVGEYHESVLHLVRGVDVLIHDAQYTMEEFRERATFGHTTPEYAVGLGTLAEVGHIVLFHHDPTRTDDELDHLAQTYEGHSPRVTVAAEGSSIELGSPGSRVG